MEFVPPRYILAPYVATPQEVAERMIELAQVGPDDVVYDLGCGDGRLLIAAAQLRGARGLGMDFEAWWVGQAQENARRAGVEQRVEFRQGDATDLDLAPANVILLYLVPWSTQLMLRKLQQDCAPGTRVVSHSFGFDGVDGVYSESMYDAEGRLHHLHRWVLVAGSG